MTAGDEEVTAEGEPRTWSRPVEGATVIVSEAIELEGEELIRFLDRACEDKPELRQEVESLLEVLRESPNAEDFLAVSASEQLAATRLTEELVVADPPPKTVGPYTIVRLLGEGGMGSVFLAEQSRPVRRQVALKIIRVLSQEPLRRRFAAECQALARLQHPNIAAMYEVGGTDDGQPYVAMEFIDGLPIGQWCDRHSIDIENRLKIFLGVCSGIRHAHEKGILHCDLKPSNVLVTRIDGQDVAKVIDFGIARAIDQPLVDEGQATREMIFGSPPYISPETLSLEGRHQLDARSDVYALGLLLHELLVGVLPFDLKGRGLLATLQHVNHTDPQKPSRRYGLLDDAVQQEIASGRATEPARLQHRIGGDLDAILLKAIDREPNRRYGSPAELAADIERHLQHRPIEARPATTIYLAKRFGRRNAGAVLAAALVFLALLVGLVARSVEADRAQRALAQSEQLRLESEEVQSFLLELFAAASPERAKGNNLTVRELLDQGTDDLKQGLRDQPLVRARLLHMIGSVYTRLGELQQASAAIQDALEIRREHHPADHPEVVESESEAGVILRRLGQLDEAEPLLRSALETRLRLPDVDPEDLAVAHTNLGNLLWSQGRLDEAETSHRAALDLRRHTARQLGTDHSLANEAYSANNLGVMLLSQGKYSQARPFLRRAVEVFRRDQHGSLGSALNNLGLVERRLPSWRQAQELFEEALVVNENTYGPIHLRSLNCRQNLINELTLRHRWQEALEQGSQAIAMAEQLDGVNRLISLLRLVSRTESLAGLHEQSLTTARRAIQVAREAYGDEHRSIFRSRAILALNEAASGRTDWALTELEALTRESDKALGDNHSDSHWIRFKKAQVLAQAGRLREAKRLVVAYISFQDKRGKDLEVAEGHLTLGRSMAEQKRHGEARRHLHLAMQIYQQTYGESHPKLAEALFHLAQVAQDSERSSEARSFADRTVEIRRSVFAEDDPDLLAAQELQRQIAGSLP